MRRSWDALQAASKQGTRVNHRKLAVTTEILRPRTQSVVSVGWWAQTHGQSAAGQGVSSAYPAYIPLLFSY